MSDDGTGHSALFHHDLLAISLMHIPVQPSFFHPADSFAYASRVPQRYMFVDTVWPDGEKFSPREG